MSEVSLKDYVDARLNSEEKQRGLLSAAMEHRLGQMTNLQDQLDKERGLTV